MQYIYDDKSAGNITASTADANYPVTNLENYNPKSVWKATGASATLTVTVTGVGYYAWAIFNSIPTITYVIYNGGTPAGSGTMETDTNGNHWLDAQLLTPTSHIVFTLSAVSGVAYAGILRGGGYHQLHDTDILQKDYLDYSLIDRTRNQALDIRAKEVVWHYSGSVPSNIGSTDGTPFLLYLAKEQAPYPLAIKVLEYNYTDFVFGTMVVTSSGAIVYQRSIAGVDNTPHIMCDFDITEVL